MKRIYEPLIQNHLQQFRQMVFLSGPRQAGKTTISKISVQSGFQVSYLNWDNAQNRKIILGGTDALLQQFSLHHLSAANNKVIIFDEIHKYSRWKNLLKGYFDHLENQCKFIVTGSAKLNIYRRGGDSMMGRYFLYRIHPLSLAECIQPVRKISEILPPKKPDLKTWDNLMQFGGFPEPFLQATPQFYQQWQNLRQEQLFREDLRDLKKIHEIHQLELLAELLKHQVGSTAKYSELAKKIQVSEPTIRNWINVLNEIYYCFSIKPWSKNVARSLLKEPKIYLWDWSVVPDQGARIENFVASHLLKAVHYWTDTGLGKYSLHYLRDKDKREVDFLIVKNELPWLMIEVKSSDNTGLNPNLLHFNKQLSVPHVLQAVYDAPFIKQSCFDHINTPMIVPVQTLLSQLV